MRILIVGAGAVGGYFGGRLAQAGRDAQTCREQENNCEAATSKLDQSTSDRFPDQNAAIGAVNGATPGWFDPQRKMYKKIPINAQHEVIGMSGDIALYQGKPVVHTHMLVGNADGTTRGGHVLADYVSPTLEVMVTVDSVTMQKRFDPDTDLTLIDPSLVNKEDKQE